MYEQLCRQEEMEILWYFQEKGLHKQYLIREEQDLHQVISLNAQEIWVTSQEVIGLVKARL